MVFRTEMRKIINQMKGKSETMRYTITYFKNNSITIKDILKKNTLLRLIKKNSNNKINVLGF